MLNIGGEKVRPAPTHAASRPGITERGLIKIKTLALRAKEFGRIISKLYSSIPLFQ